MVVPRSSLGEPEGRGEAPTCETVDNKRFFSCLATSELMTSSRGRTHKTTATTAKSVRGVEDPSAKQWLTG